MFCYDRVIVKYLNTHYHSILSVHITWRWRIGEIIVLLYFLSIIVSIWQWWSSMMDKVQGSPFTGGTNRRGWRGRGPVICTATRGTTGPL